MAERITKSHLISSERFCSICPDKFEMWNLYVKIIMFAYSRPTSTSTWHSEYCNGPGVYMSGELKLENIKYRKAPTRRSHHLAKDPQSSYHIQPNPRKISVPYTRLFTILERPSRPIRPYNQDPPQSTKTLTDCCSYLNAIIIDDLEYSLKEAGEFKIIIHYYSLASRESPEK
jgi:hypothetical protein